MDASAVRSTYGERPDRRVDLLIGTAQAHRTVSAAPPAIAVHFHEPVQWDGRLRHHHESNYAGAGWASSAAGCRPRRTLDRFIRPDAMIRAFEAAASAAISLPVQSRLGTATRMR